MYEQLYAKVKPFQVSLHCEITSYYWKVCRKFLTLCSSNFMELVLLMLCVCFSTSHVRFLRFLLLLDHRNSWTVLQLRGTRCSMRKGLLRQSWINWQMPTPTCWAIRTNDRKSSTWSSSRRRTWSSSRSGLPCLYAKLSCWASPCEGYSKLCCKMSVLVVFTGGGQAEDTGGKAEEGLGAAQVQSGVTPFRSQQSLQTRTKREPAACDAS